MRAPTQLPARLRGPGAVAVPQPGGGAPGARGAAPSLWQEAGEAEFVLFAYSRGTLTVFSNSSLSWIPTKRPVRGRCAFHL